MPTPILNAYAEQLPRLSAEESLLFANRIAVGTGSLNKGEGRRIASGWQRIAGEHRAVVRSKGPGEYAAHMAALGIGVKREKRAKPDG
jgi:hypothetical protein